VPSLATVGDTRHLPLISLPQALSDIGDRILDEDDTAYLNYLCLLIRTTFSLVYGESVIIYRLSVVLIKVDS
jgi:hypothetical protein